MNTYCKSEVYVVGEKSGCHNTKTINNTIELYDEEDYYIIMKNNTKRRMKVTLNIRGKYIGVFYVKPEQESKVARCTKYLDCMNTFKFIKVNKEDENLHVVCATVEYEKEDQTARLKDKVVTDAVSCGTIGGWNKKYVKPLKIDVDFGMEEQCASESVDVNLRPQYKNKNIETIHGGTTISDQKLKDSEHFYTDGTKDVYYYILHAKE